jgi:hypothetical protein
MDNEVRSRAARLACITENLRDPALTPISFLLREKKADDAWELIAGVRGRTDALDVHPGDEWARHRALRREPNGCALPEDGRRR